MAANPIQYLKHGKALCGKAFRTFVETFNWHTAFCLNLKGDGDFPASQGKVSLDRSNPDFPVIRCKGCTSSGEGGSPAVDKSCFRLESRETTGGSLVYSLVDCYFSIGGCLLHTNDIPVTGLEQTTEEEDEGDEDEEPEEKILYVRFNARAQSDRSQSVSSGLCTMEGLEGLQKDAEYYTYPLYVMAGDVVKTDLRTALSPQMVELIELNT